MRVATALLAGAALSLAGCALDPVGAGGVTSGNAGRVRLYTPQEQDAMTVHGTLPTMIAPSELRAALSGGGRADKPTGEVNYCDAGLPALVRSRRAEALAAIDSACGGQDRYTIRHEGLGDVQSRYLGSMQLTPGCTRSRVVVFRCADGRPAPDARR